MFKILRFFRKPLVSLRLSFQETPQLLHSSGSCFPRPSPFSVYLATSLLWNIYKTYFFIFLEFYFCTKLGKELPEL